MSSPVLLDDATMRRFIRDGYLMLQPSFPQGFNEAIYQKIESVLAKGGNPGNNLLPRVPELQQMLEHPAVHGALYSILGPDYYLHLHRHVHDNPPGSKGQHFHKDSLDNSRYAADNKRRHHRTRWLMLFYYPQDTPVELGPTAIVPKSQYLNVDRPEGEEEVVLSGEAGTVCIVHYDLLHRGTPNVSDRMRYMAKFLFTRMSEPQAPAWDHRNAAWEPTSHPQEPIWHHLWDWHRGVPDAREPSSEEPMDTLASRLSDPSDITALTAGYELGTRGESAVPALIDALHSEEDAAPRNAAYAFNRIGAAAVPRLLDAAGSLDARVRARALDILGDMGADSEAAIPSLICSLADAEDDPRRRAAEALGTAGLGAPNAGQPLAQTLGSDASGEVRRNAALSLARLGPLAVDAVPTLATAMMDANHYVRGYAVYALSRIGTPEANAALVKHLQTMRWDAA